MNQKHYNTAQAARLIGLSPAALRSRIANFKIDPPRKDIAGRFIWTELDIEMAKARIRNGVSNEN
jgi:hypothetical protein